MNRLRDYKLPELREEIKKWCLFENRMEYIISRWEECKTEVQEEKYLKSLSKDIKESLMGYLLSWKNLNPLWVSGKWKYKHDRKIQKRIKENEKVCKRSLLIQRNSS